MGLAETIVFYLLFGAGTAAAITLRRDPGQSAGTWFRAATAIFFWPLYIPVLLAPSTRQAVDLASGINPGESRRDEYEAAISRVEAELETALDSLDGWAENVLAREEDRFSELRSAWRAQADRIRQLDRLLATADQQEAGAEETSRQSDMAEQDRARLWRFEQSRRENLDRLHKVRRHLHNDLFGTLAWVRELVSMIHVAKFTGAPASRAEELVGQIATAVEGLSEVTQWREDPTSVGR